MLSGSWPWRKSMTCRPYNIIRRRLRVSPEQLWRAGPAVVGELLADAMRTLEEQDREANTQAAALQQSKLEINRLERALVDSEGMAELQVNGCCVCHVGRFVNWIW
jgi:hypothetical protein